jgi:ubiquinone/menaquinone biosynthesis C-methylase UbiE
MSARFEDYLRQVRLEQLLEKLGVPNPKVLAKTVEHFTTKEGEKRDKIVSDYFGQRAIGQIVDEITESLTTPPMLAADAKVLDVGAGSGFFTVRVAEKVRKRLPRASFYAMDLTTAMLRSLVRKEAHITAFVGLAENIEGSINQANEFLRIPRKFDAAFSTLMLHHSAQPERVFESTSRVLKKNGRAVIVDLCEHGFSEFKVEMGDVHLGFKPVDINTMAQKYFSAVKVRKIPGICCRSSGRSAEIFVATMQTPVRLD